jgi:hypothetical protein
MVTSKSKAPRMDINKSKVKAWTTAEQEGKNTVTSKRKSKAWARKLNAWLKHGHQQE